MFYGVHSATLRVTLNLLGMRSVSFVGPWSTVRLGAGPYGTEPWLKRATKSLFLCWAYSRARPSSWDCFLQERDPSVWSSSMLVAAYRFVLCVKKFPFASSSTPRVRLVRFPTLPHACNFVLRSLLFLVSVYWSLLVILVICDWYNFLEAIT